MGNLLLKDKEGRGSPIEKAHLIKPVSRPRLRLVHWTPLRGKGTWWDGDGERRTLNLRISRPDPCESLYKIGRSNR